MRFLRSETFGLLVFVPCPSAPEWFPRRIFAIAIEVAVLGCQCEIHIVVTRGKFLTERKKAQTQTFESDIFRWGRGLAREGVGAKKIGMSLETREIKLF